MEGLGTKRGAVTRHGKQVRAESKIRESMARLPFWHINREGTIQNESSWQGRLGSGDRRMEDGLGSRQYGQSGERAAGKQGAHAPVREE